MGKFVKSGGCGGNVGDAALADGLGDLQRQAGAVARGEHAGQIRPQHPPRLPPPLWKKTTMARMP